MTSVDYFLADGGGGNDDFVIRVSFDRKTLLDVSQLYNLKDCPDSTAKLCFISKALTFSSEPMNGATSWTVDGLEFKSAGFCVSKLCKGMKMALKIIHSSRDGNGIDFYYSDAYGLMGWSTTYPREKGYVETFMQLPPKKTNGEITEKRRPGK